MGAPAAVTCDPAGNVYAACAEGVEVWSSGGTALGLIKIPGIPPFNNDWKLSSFLANIIIYIGICSSLCFGCNGELFVCGGQTLWRVQLEGTIFHTK